MKGKYILCGICAVLLTSCAFSDGKQTPEITLVELSSDTGEMSSETDKMSYGDMEMSSDQTEPSSERSGTDGWRKLNREETDFILDRIYSYALDCGDGSQIITAGLADGMVYIRYLPQRLGDGNYRFFRCLRFTEDVTYREDGTVDIPVTINGEGKSRFVVNVTYSFSEGNVNIDQAEFTVPDRKDNEFHQMYQAFDSQAQMDYRLSLKPDGMVPEDQLAGYLRACVYNGNSYVLGRLYEMTTEEETEQRYALELAGSRSDDFEHTWSAENPLLPEVFYGESCKDFPQMDTLAFVAEGLRNGTSMEERGAKLLEPNLDLESVFKIPGLQELYPYVYGDENITGVYKHDLDGDGLPEILVVFPGGSMGNLFWEVLHLNEAGTITTTNSGEGLGWLSLYEYQGNYFFTTDIIDFNDKELLGWEVFAVNGQDQMYSASVSLEKCGTETVFTDQYGEVDSYFYLDWELGSYIDRYKSYEAGVLGREIETSEELQSLFHEEGNNSGTYGTMDFNNDGIDDWTRVYQFYTSTRHPYYCNNVLVDGKTNQVFDFSDLADLSYDLRAVYSYQPDETNYMICLLGGSGNYVFKLLAFDGMEPVEVQSWYVAVRTRILIQVTENNGARIGV